jgi:transcriptional regulator with XRE-family HTH domain
MKPRQAEAAAVLDLAPVSTAFMKSLGELLREARAGRFTIEELAQRANVSAGRISQIERGIANPSFETLWRLASALEVPLGSLFEGTGPKQDALVRRDERKRIEIPVDGLVYELLTPNMQGSLEIFVLDIPPSYDGARRPLVHRGEKFIHVQKGELVVQAGDRRWMLQTGDSVTFNASDAHFVCNEAASQATILVVVTPPSF